MWDQLPNDIIINILQERRLIREKERIKRQMWLCHKTIENIGKGKFILVDHEQNWFERNYNKENKVMCHLAYCILCGFN
jgi:hypothetical protein